jgi:predicted RNA-binding protein with PIN domain
MPYLIDGNNVLGSWGGPRLGRDGRSEVVRRVAAFCRDHGVRATVVFDGQPFRGDQPSQQLGSLSIRFPPRGRDADSVIRRLVENAPRPSELIVVTSDKALYSYVKTRGASAMSAREWNALARAAASRRRGASGSEKPDQEDDIEGWLERFGARD